MNLLETRIDLSAVAFNTAKVKEMIGTSQLMCVVKADGYNHGAIEVARVMSENGADQFGVATLAEALELRRAGIEKPILCWIWSPEQDFQEALDADIDLAVVSKKHAYALQGKTARVTIKVDTGLHRSGVDEDEWDEVFQLLRDEPGLEVTGLFSHLACADDPSSPYTDEQGAVFRRAIARGRELGLALPVNHLANSAATMTRPDLYFDMVRPGLILYGLEPLAGADNGLKPAMSWVGKVTVVKPISAGEGTSYSLTWSAERDGYLAVVPAGYADGVPRAAQDHIVVTINGHSYPQVGRVCMDQFVIDLGDNPYGVVPGDEAIIFGPGGMSATALADAIGTINYEIICRPTGRTRRVHTDYLSKIEKRNTDE